MDVKQLLRYAVSIAARQSIVEVHIYAPVADLPLSAEFLSTMAADRPAAGAEIMSNIYRAMVFWLGHPGSHRLSPSHDGNNQYWRSAMKSKRLLLAASLIAAAVAAPAPTMPPIEARLRKKISAASFSRHRARRPRKSSSSVRWRCSTRFIFRTR